HDGERKLAARKKLCRLPVDRHQCGFGEYLQDSLALWVFQTCSNSILKIEVEEVQKVRYLNTVAAVVGLKYWSAILLRASRSNVLAIEPEEVDTESVQLGAVQLGKSHL